ncbi:MAG: ArsR/SmtB family transcription factor [Patescibacteria group bacterium]
MRNQKTLQKELQDNEKIEECALKFGIAGDKTRLKICYLLCHYPELSVGSIAETVGKSISTVSRSLKKLKEAGVVVNRREAKKILYSLENNEFVLSLKNQLLV